jgi:hypothetical protein
VGTQDEVKKIAINLINIHMSLYLLLMHKTCHLKITVITTTSEKQEYVSKKDPHIAYRMFLSLVIFPKTNQ